MKQKILITIIVVLTLLSLFFLFFYIKQIKFTEQINLEKQSALSNLEDYKTKISELPKQPATEVKKITKITTSTYNSIEIQPSKTIPQWLTYKNNNLKFSISFPQEWYLTDTLQNSGQGRFTDKGLLNSLTIGEPNGLYSFSLSIEPPPTGFYTDKIYDLKNNNERWTIGKKMLNETGGEGYDANYVKEHLKTSKTLVISLNGYNSKNQQLFIEFDYDRLHELEAEDILNKLVESIVF